MEAVNDNRKIEEAAILALRSTLLRCPKLETYINANDRTPSWDGDVFVYNSQDHKKENLMSRVPVQVKGTRKWFEDNNVSYSCNIVDLKNYYNDGGCIFFLIGVIPETGKFIIFYISLVQDMLEEILEGARTQKTYTLHLSRFPENDMNKIESIFQSFINARCMQQNYQNSMIVERKKLDHLKNILPQEEKRIRRGNVIRFGKYHINGSGHEKDVTIEWIVLDVKANVALLVSKNVLEAKPYHSEQKEVDWEKSSIRSWLNSDFFFAAFTGNERLCILNSKVNTPKNIEYGTNRNSCTIDRVFLLSIEEAEHYFPNAEARRAKLIDNEFEILKCFFPWWLRSSGYPAYRAAGVSKDGKILARGRKVTNTSYFVRPALRVYL